MTQSTVTAHKKHCHLAVLFLESNARRAMATPRTLSRAPRLPRGELIRQQERSKFSSCGEVPRSGEVVFFFIHIIVSSQDHPVLADTPPPEGNLVRDKKQVRHRRTSLLSALCTLLSLTCTSRRGDRHCMGDPIFHLLIFSQHHDPTRPTHAHQSAPGIYRP